MKSIDYILMTQTHLNFFLLKHTFLEYQRWKQDCYMIYKTTILRVRDRSSGALIREQQILFQHLIRTNDVKEDQ